MREGVPRYHRCQICSPRCGEPGRPAEAPSGRDGGRFRGLFGFFGVGAGGGGAVVNTQKVTDIDCVQCVTEPEKKRKVRVKWREKGRSG